MMLDLSEVTFIDASALGMLTTTRRELDDVEGTMSFVAYRPTFLRLCRATGLAEHFGLGGADRSSHPSEHRSEHPRAVSRLTRDTCT